MKCCKIELKEEEKKRIKANQIPEYLVCVKMNRFFNFSVVGFNVPNPPPTHCVRFSSIFGSLSLVHAVATDARDCLYNFSGQFNRFTHDMFFFCVWFISIHFFFIQFYFLAQNHSTVLVYRIRLSHMFCVFSLLSRRYLLQYKNNM